MSVVWLGDSWTVARRKRLSGDRGVKYSYIVLSLFIFLLGGCAVNPATGQRDFVLMSESQEMALGRQSSQQVMKEYRAYDKASLQQYVQSVGDRVAKVSHRQTLNYRFTLLDSSQVNAFALPGGYIYITRGLLAYLNSEAELAAVLGHELGHVTARHSVRQHSLSTATNLLGQLATAASGGSQGAGQLTNLLGTGIVRGYGRKYELEADGLGVEYLVRAGYPAQAMKSVITALKNQEVFDKQLAVEQGRQPRSYHGIFSTHPDNDTRLQEVLNKMGVSPLRQGQDVAFLKRMKGLTFGDSAKDGVIRGRYFYHTDLNFKVGFTKGWKISNQTNAIVAAAPNGEAVVQLTLQSLSKKTTPKQFLKARLGLQKILSEKALFVGKLRGYTAVINGKTAYGKGKVRVAVLFDGQQAFTFFGTIKHNYRFTYFDKKILSSIQSFSSLTGKDRRVAKELTIQLIKTNRFNSTMLSMAKSSPLSHHAEEQIRLLNSFFPQGEPKLGDLIKIVR